MNHQPVLRMGILGAARIAPMALIRPARTITDVSVDVVAARNPVRSCKFAKKHHIPRVHEKYEDVLADPEIDAVYIPLPNSLHHDWSIRAMRAGKHVLCEKPIAANAQQAEEVVKTASDTGRIIFEAMHYRFHPIATRMQEIVASGQLGTIRHIESELCVPLIFNDEIRYRYDLAGGAMMDVGCYTINIIRFLSGEEPEVTHAQANLASGQIDKHMAADFRFPSGITGRIFCSICSLSIWRTNVTVRGDQGKLRVFNPFLPQIMCHRLRIRDGQGNRTETVTGESTFACQLRAFAKAVRGEQSSPVLVGDSVANMRIVDAVYGKAGLTSRGT